MPDFATRGNLGVVARSRPGAMTESTQVNIGLLSRNTGLLLLAGFGGLLALMAVAGIDTMRVLRMVQDRNDAIRRDYLARNRLLNQIRSDLYLSGTYVRDYLLEPDPKNAERHRTSLSTTRKEMESALGAYSGLASSGEAKPFASLQQELAQYWRVLEPVMRWDAAERQARGYAFLRDEVFPRRMAMLSIADQIGAVNEQQLNTGDVQVADLFSGFRIRLSIMLLVTLAVGAALAGFSMLRILRLERESAARFRETAQARMELKELSARLVEAQESERRAISRELHDEVGQSLSALVVGLGNLGAAIPSAANTHLAANVEELRKLAQSSVGLVRNMALLLRPSMLDDLGLVPALQWQAREVSKRTGLIVNVAADGVPDELPEEYKTSIYRVVQEALHNCEQHAQAKLVRVTIRQQQESLLLSIQDDGRGFQPQSEKGLGLLGMQERVARLGGTFHVDSQVGHGTLVMVRLPFAHEARNGA